MRFADISVRPSSFQQFSGPTLPTKTWSDEMDAAPSPTGTASILSHLFLKPESPPEKETLVMNNKANVLHARQAAEENRKQLLRDIASNIEQLCIALSMSYPNLVEIQESNVRTTEQSASDANIDPAFTTSPTTSTQPNETDAAHSITKPAIVSSSYFPKSSANRATRMIQATR